MDDERILNIIEALQELTTDGSVPKNVKSKLEIVVNTLKQESEEISIRVNKALSELDEVSEDSNLQSFTRTQLWNIASMLEMI